MATDTLLGSARDWHWCEQSVVGMVHCVLAWARAQTARYIECVIRAIPDNLDL